MKGIRIVKYYAWEVLSMQWIESLRNLELLKVRKGLGVDVEKSATFFGTDCRAKYERSMCGRLCC